MAAGPEGEWVLRIVDLSDGSSRTVPVPPERRSLYVDVEAGGTYGFELAVRGGGRWRTICRTERIEMPPDLTGKARSARSRRRMPPAQAGIPGLDLQATLPHLGSSFHDSAERGRGTARKAPSRPSSP